MKIIIVGELEVRLPFNDAIKMVSTFLKLYEGHTEQTAREA